METRMRRASTALVAGTIVAAALFAHGGRVIAQTATTTTTTTATTTTTTIPPHPFSPATASCVKQVQRSLRACRHGGTAEATCRSQYETAFSNCFAPGAGASCAKK